MTSLPLTCTLLFLTVALLPHAAQAQDRNEVPVADSPADVQPGMTVLLKTEGKYPCTYFLRVPKSYNEKQGARIVVFMHGSNMNGLSYLRSFEAAKWCENDILVCPNGERGNKDKDPYGAHNFTFGAANYVAALTKELKKAFHETRVYIGGHSQGGFCTYSCIMHFPDLYDGAFPMAGDCWSQNEPNLWESKPESVKKQKRIAIAVIHGQADPVVKYSQGEHAHGVFQAMGYPKLRFFNPERLGHQFMLSPVDDALEWLDAMNGDNAVRSLQLVAEWVEQEEWGWVHQAALAILKNGAVHDDVRSQCEKLIAAVETIATAEVPVMEQSMQSGSPSDWIEKWFVFRSRYGATKAAASIVADFEEKRAETREKSQKLFFAAMRDFRASWSEDLDETEKKALKDEGYEKYEQILAEAPCTYHAKYALDGLRGRKEK